MRFSTVGSPEALVFFNFYTSNRKVTARYNPPGDIPRNTNRNFNLDPNPTFQIKLG